MAEGLITRIRKSTQSMGDVGGCRLHLLLHWIGHAHGCTLAGDLLSNWYLAQQKASAFARVCSYDRAGTAWSDPGPQPRTMRQKAYELHTALRRAKERGP